MAHRCGGSSYDLDQLYLKALYLVRAEGDANSEMRTLPEACPFTSGELLNVEPDVAALMIKIENNHGVDADRQTPKGRLFDE